MHIPSLMEAITEEQLAAATAAGASPEQVEQVYNLAPFIIDTVDAYTAALSNGATHDQVLEAFESVGDLGGYAEALSVGATHEEILEVGNAYRIVSDYARLRGRGHSHSEAITIADLCEAEGVLECDTCEREYATEPEGSFQTYNGRWFCSIECGRKAGW